MKNIILALSIALMFIQCNQKRSLRYFFNATRGYPSFKGLKDSMPLFGLDSLIVDSLSTHLGNMDYWYMNSASDGLLNIQGYLRCSNGIVYIKPGDRETGKHGLEQIFLDFTGDTTKSYLLKYQRDHGMCSLMISKQLKFYNERIKDSVIVFKVYSEVKDISFTNELLLQASLRQGLVSIRYLATSSKRVYTIDYLPVPNVSYSNVSTPIYPNE